MIREEKIVLLIDELEDIRCENFDADTDEDKTLKEVISVIKALEQELISKTGRWVYIGNGCNGLHKCSKCGVQRKMFDELDNYCPNCGVKMDIPGKG